MASHRTAIGGRVIHHEVSPIGLGGIVFAGVSLCILWILGCDTPDLPRALDPAIPPLNVNVIELKEHTGVYDSRLHFGTLKPRRSSNLGFARGGRVNTVLVSVGDIAAKDEEIALLEQTQLDAELAIVTDAIATVRQDLAGLGAGNNSLRQQEIKNLQQQLGELERQRRELVSDVENGKLVAPYDCVIAERNINEGDTVSIGRPVFKIDESAPPVVEINVPVRLTDQLQKGRRVWVYKDGAPWKATVESKSPEIDAATRTQSVVLSLITDTENPDWKFGEVVKVRFWIQTTESGFWLPYSALQREADGLWSAYVVVGAGEAEEVSRRTLEVLRIDEEAVLARGSLNAGERLIIDGLNRVVPGQRVRGTLVTREFQIPGPPGAGG